MDNLTLYSLTTPQSVPLPLFYRVKEEIDQIEKTGVICRVDELNQWCPGMIFITKSNPKYIYVLILLN